VHATLLEPGTDHHFAAGFHDPGGGALTLFVNPELSRPAPWPDSPQASSRPRLTASASVQSTRRYRNQGIGRALPTKLDSLTS
jgi:hypothetical protein